jgi:hypothetical protein
MHLHKSVSEVNYCFVDKCIYVYYTCIIKCVCAPPLQKVLRFILFSVCKRVTAGIAVSVTISSVICSSCSESARV